MTEQVSRFNVYRGYSTPVYDGWRRFAQYVSARDGTRLAVDLPAHRWSVCYTALPIHREWCCR